MSVVQVLPYPATAAGPAGDMTVAVQSFATGTTTGPQSQLNATLTGLTPKAALFFGSYHNVVSDPGETARASISIGALGQTGTGSVVSGQSYDAFGNTNTNSLYQSDNGSNTGAYLLRTASTTRLQGRAAFASGGMDLNFATISGFSYRASYMAFAGTIASKADVVDLGTGTGAISIATAFEPDVVFVLGSGGIATNSIQTNMTLSFGVAVNGGGQYCLLAEEVNGLADGTPIQAVLTNRAGGNLTGGSLAYHLTIGGFSGTGFTITPSASAGDDDISYLALDLGGRRAKLVLLTTPTAIGSQAITGAGFTPQAAIVVLTTSETFDPSYPLASSANTGGFSIAALADNTASHSFRAQSGAAITNTASQATNGTLIGASHVDCDALKATLDSFDSDGMTLNWSAVAGTGKKGFVLFLE